jgi:hypothetical protein
MSAGLKTQMAEKVVELKIAPKVSTMSVQRALKK